MTVEHPTLPAGVQIKPIPNYPGYYASSDGRIWSDRRAGFRPPPKTLRELKPTVAKSGHLVHHLSAGPGKIHSVHRLVLQAFIGPCPDGMEACHHPDPTPSNCRIENLRWDTRQANHDDKCRMARQARGSRLGSAKLMEAQVHEIRRLSWEGVSQRELGRRFGVDRVNIRAILTARIWAHLPDAVGMEPRKLLTELQAAEIIHLRSAGMSLKEIAEKVGTTFSNVSLIALGKSWRSLHHGERWRTVLAEQSGR